MGFVKKKGWSSFHASATGSATGGSGGPSHASRESAARSRAAMIAEGMAGGSGRRAGEKAPRDRVLDKMDKLDRFADPRSFVERADRGAMGGPPQGSRSFHRRGNSHGNNSHEGSPMHPRPRSFHSARGRGETYQAAEALPRPPFAPQGESSVEPPRMGGPSGRLERRGRMTSSSQQSSVASGPRRSSQGSGPPQQSRRHPHSPTRSPTKTKGEGMILVDEKDWRSARTMGGRGQPGANHESKVQPLPENSPRGQPQPPVDKQQQLLLAKAFINEVNGNTSNPPRHAQPQHLGQQQQPISSHQESKAGKIIPQPNEPIDATSASTTSTGSSMLKNKSPVCVAQHISPRPVKPTGTNPPHCPKTTSPVAKPTLKSMPPHRINGASSFSPIHANPTVNGSIEEMVKNVRARFPPPPPRQSRQSPPVLTKVSPTPGQGQTLGSNHIAGGSGHKVESAAALGQMTAMLANAEMGESSEVHNEGIRRMGLPLTSAEGNPSGIPPGTLQRNRRYSAEEVKSKQPPAAGRAMRFPPPPKGGPKRAAGGASSSGGAPPIPASIGGTSASAVPTRQADGPPNGAPLTSKNSIGNSLDALLDRAASSSVPTRQSDGPTSGAPLKSRTSGDSLRNSIGNSLDELRSFDELDQSIKSLDLLNQDLEETRKQLGQTQAAIAAVKPPPPREGAKSAPLGKGGRRDYSSFLTETRRQLGQAQEAIALANPGASANPTAAAATTATMNPVPATPKSVKPCLKATATHKCRGKRKDYSLGDIAKSPSHMIEEADAEKAAEAIGTLNEQDFAFVKRSDGRYSYAILARKSGEESDGALTSLKEAAGLEECLTFVLSPTGCTKSIRKSQWGEFVRLVNDESDASKSAPTPLESLKAPDTPKTEGMDMDKEDKEADDDNKSNTELEEYIRKLRKEFYDARKNMEVLSKEDFQPPTAIWVDPTLAALEDDTMSAVSTPFDLLMLGSSGEINKDEEGEGYTPTEPVILE